jgi:hypothetical protein
MEFVDPLGNMIKVGDTVIYPTTRGKSPIIVKGVVASIEQIRSHSLTIKLNNKK